jgi:hypothetical protein
MRSSVRQRWLRAPDLNLPYGQSAPTGHEPQPDAAYSDRGPERGKTTECHFNLQDPNPRVPATFLAFPGTAAMPARLPLAI